MAKKAPKTKIRYFLYSYKKAINAQKGLLRSLYGSTNWDIRETWIVISFPRCTWKYKTIGNGNGFSVETPSPKNVVRIR